MTVTFSVTADGGGTVNNGGRRVLVAKTDSLSNVNNNNVPAATTSPVENKASVMSVRRVLFGPPADPAETRAWLDRQLCAATAADTKSWNFDFANERPLPDNPADRYLWERVLPPRHDVAQAAANSSTGQQQDWRAIAANKQKKQTKLTGNNGRFNLFLFAYSFFFLFFFSF